VGTTDGALSEQEQEKAPEEEKARKFTGPPTLDQVIEFSNELTKECHDDYAGWWFSMHGEDILWQSKDWRRKYSSDLLNMISRAKEANQNR
jgi:hypothetical protein